MKNKKIQERTIRTCEVLGKDNNYYYLYCKFKGGKRSSVLYTREDEKLYINKYGKRLYVNSESYDIVLNSIKQFNLLVEKLMNQYKVDLSELGKIIYYSIDTDNKLSLLLIDNCNNGIAEIKHNGKIEDMINFVCFTDRREYGLTEVIMHSNKESIYENPIYKSFVENKQDCLAIEMKLYYHLENKKEIGVLEKFFGKRVLPALTEKYNRDYVVDCDTIDSSLLLRSGYRIMHRPYFSMINSTHESWTLNPCTKVGVDAAKINEDCITFNEFLELFDDEQNK